MRPYDITITFFFVYEFQQIYGVWDHGFGREKPRKPSEKFKKKPYIFNGQKNLLNLIRKQEEITRSSINEKLIKLN